MDNIFLLNTRNPLTDAHALHTQAHSPSVERAELITYNVESLLSTI